MRVCAFTDLQSIYVHSMEKDKLMVKVSETGIPELLTCLPSSDRTSLEITYLTGIRENEKKPSSDGGGNEVFVRETVSLEDWNRQQDCIEVTSINKVVYKTNSRRKFNKT